jgi:hypothetical protein
MTALLGLLAIAGYQNRDDEDERDRNTVALDLSAYLRVSMICVLPRSHR